MGVYNPGFAYQSRIHQSTCGGVLHGSGWLVLDWYRGTQAVFGQIACCASVRRTPRRRHAQHSDGLLFHGQRKRRMCQPVRQPLLQGGQGQGGKPDWIDRCELAHKRKNSDIGRTGHGTAELGLSFGIGPGFVVAATRGSGWRPSLLPGGGVEGLWRLQSAAGICSGPGGA